MSLLRRMRNELALDFNIEAPVDPPVRGLTVPLVGLSERTPHKIALYAVEPNHGELVNITPDGKVARVVDISASQGHVVPTVVAEHGSFYVSNLGEFDPDQLNTQSVFRLRPAVS